MSLIRRVLPFALVIATAFFAPTTAAPKQQASPQPQLITVELTHSQVKKFYAKPTQASVEPGGFEVDATSPAEWFMLGFKAGDIILNLNGSPVGERLHIGDGVHFFDVLRNKKPILLRVIVHPAPRKSYTLEEERFDRLIDHLDPAQTNGPHATPVRNASGPSGVRVTGTLLSLYLSCDTGDLIRTIDNLPIHTEAELVAALRSLRVGITEVALERLGQPITLTLVRKAPLDLTGVKKLAPTRFEVTRVFADAIKADTDILARKLSTTPVIKNGKPHGFTLYDIKPDAPAAILGFLDGDVVLDVDGNRIDSYSDVRDATTQLEHVASLVVHIERKGKPVTLTYVIR
jgi:S1-C subfamily serine protease